MTPAPATGRTADENELREVLRGMRRERDSWKELAAENAIAADRYAQEAATARKERDEAQAQYDRLGYVWEQPTNDLHEAIEKGFRVEAAEANLIALAKMYGEACGALAEYRFAAVEWQGEQAEYKAAVETEAAHLRAENANLRDRVREAEGAAEGMREACLKAAISASYGPPSSWPGSYPRGWKHPPCWEPGQKPTPDQAAWHDNGARDAWFAIRSLAAKAAPLPGSDTGGKGA